MSLPEGNQGITAAYILCHQFFITLATNRARNRDDLSRSFLFHVRDDRLRDCNRSQHVYLEHVFDSFLGDLLEESLASQTSNVD